MIGGVAPDGPGRNETGGIFLLVTGRRQKDSRLGARRGDTPLLVTLPASFGHSRHFGRHRHNLFVGGNSHNYSVFAN